jgi:hypothetical protein
MKKQSQTKPIRQEQIAGQAFYRSAFSVLRAAK